MDEQRNGCFRDWLDMVNKVLLKRAGLERSDLPDCPYYDWYEHRMTAHAAAAAAIRNARGEE